MLILRKNNNEGWEYAQEILDMMGENDYHEAVYGCLFNLCGGRFCGKLDLDKLYQVYDEMRDKGFKLNNPSGNSLLHAGIDHYRFEFEKNPENKAEIQKDIKQYVDWVVMEFGKYNINLTKMQEERLHHKLATAM